MSVTALCEEVTRRLRSQEPWEVEEIAERLGRVAGGEYSAPLLLNLAVAAVLELSRSVNSTETPTSENTCKSAGRPSEPSAEEIRVVKEALLSGPGWSCSSWANGPETAFLMAEAAIRALDEHRASPSRTPR